MPRHIYSTVALIVIMLLYTAAANDIRVFFQNGGPLDVGKLDFFFGRPKVRTNYVSM